MEERLQVWEDLVVDRVPGHAVDGPGVAAQHGDGLVSLHVENVNLIIAMISLSQDKTMIKPCYPPIQRQQKIGPHLRNNCEWCKSPTMNIFYPPLSQIKIMFLLELFH